MKLFIDMGNTRIKWGLADGQDWRTTHALLVEQADELTQRFAGLKNVQQAWVSNVAGEEAAQHVRDACAGLFIQPQFIVAQETQCGVHNSYSSTMQLGSDRWAGLIAAWHLVQGACLVVSSGTATTIDALSAEGKFIGGLILPGVELMQRSLHDTTAQLQGTPAGEYAPFPLNTADALYSGALQASCGAIERQYVLLEEASAPVVLSGGAATALHSRLNVPSRIVDNLVLQGLLLIAQETDAR